MNILAIICTPSTLVSTREAPPTTKATQCLLRWLVTMLAWSLSSHVPAQQESIFDGYIWQQVGSGVYLHRQVDPLAGPVDGNTVVIVNAEDVFVVDTHINPAATRAVLEKIKAMTDLPVGVVINTHWHDDHTNGNYVYRRAFPGTSIIAHRATLDALRAEWPAMIAQRRQAYGAIDLQQLLETSNNVAQNDPQRAYDLHIFAAYKQALEPELTELELVYPDTILEDRLVFERGDRTIVVEWIGRGNTDGDVIVRLVEEEILITGDLLVAPIPFAFSSPMVDWIQTLEKIAAMSPLILIPGHGEPMTNSDYLGRVLSLLRETVTAVRVAHDSGIELEALESTITLSEQEQLFVAGDTELAYAWHAYFFTPGLRSAWESLGYPVPDN